MIASSARMATPLARQALRQGARSASAAPLLGASQRRMARGTTKAAVEQTKSDAPWAVGSLVVFGSLFIYLTSPPKGGKKGHGHEAEHEEESSGSDDSGEEEEEEENTTYDNVKKIEDKPGKDSPKGGQHLAERSLTAEDGAHKQKTSKEPSGKPDDITFKTGVSAAKEGHSGAENSHISDPKKVVADAHAKRQEGKAKGDEAKEVEQSPQAADANAQNKEQDKEDEESQAVHDSENAKKANAINEEEGSDKED